MASWDTKMDVEDTKTDSEDPKKGIEHTLPMNIPAFLQRRVSNDSGVVVGSSSPGPYSPFSLGKDSSFMFDKPSSVQSQSPVHMDETDEIDKLGHFRSQPHRSRSNSVSLPVSFSYDDARRLGLTLGRIADDYKNSRSRGQRSSSLKDNRLL